MTNFEKITASPEALAEFLASFPVANDPWDVSFHEQFCDNCEREDCDGEPCPHQDKRYNPLWWLTKAAEGELETEEQAAHRDFVMRQTRAAQERSKFCTCPRCGTKWHRPNALYCCQCGAELERKDAKEVAKEIADGLTDLLQYRKKLEERREVSPEELPEPLREVKKNCPEIKVYEAPRPTSYGLSGKLNYMEIAALMMFEIGKLLWGNDKKFRVTIECNPETGRFEAKREDIEKETAPASEAKGRQDAATLSVENRQRQEYLNLARQFHLPISAAIEHYDTLSQQGTQHGT